MANSEMATINVEIRIPWLTAIVLQWVAARPARKRQRNCTHCAFTGEESVVFHRGNWVLSTLMRLIFSARVLDDLIHRTRHTSRVLTISE
jgi:hypothetical protein